MPSIDTLIDDMYAVLERGVDVSPFHHDEPDHNKEDEYLRLSNVGQPCARKLWYTLNDHDAGEDLQPRTKMQFMIGHVVEHVAIDIAKQAGHTVTNEQEEVEVNGIRGHIDCIIDGVLVDVKSASPYSFLKFKQGLEKNKDAFGYLVQLGSYLSAVRARFDGVARNKAAFLVIHKVTGELCLDVHEFSDRQIDDILGVIEERKEIVKKEQPPSRGFDHIPIGKSGNYGLDTNCSYCQFKNLCWPGLRTFLYANGPVFLTRVERAPNVPEATKTPGS